MKKTTILKEIQDRLPENIYIWDETDFEFNEDEYIGILSWIKYFNQHFKNHGFSKNTDIIFSLISKRIRLDFGHYREPDKEGLHVIYISSNLKDQLTDIKRKPTIKTLIQNWNL